MAQNPPDDPSPQPTNEPPDLAGGAHHEDGLFAGWQLPEQFDFLRNRLLLAGFGVLGVLLLSAIVLVILGGAADDDDDASASTVETPEVENTPNPDFSGRLLTTATMRVGPGLGYAIMGTIPEDAVVVVSGRNEDNTWLQVIYPPGEELRGWVPIEQIELTGEIEELSVEGPGEVPDVVIPTEIYVEPFTSTPVPFTAPPRNTPRPTRPPALPTSTPAAPPTNTPPAIPTNTPPGP